MSLKRRLSRGLRSSGRYLGKASLETGRFAGFHLKKGLREYAETHLGPVSHEERRAYLEGYRSGALERARELGRQRASLIGQERKEIRHDARQARKIKKQNREIRHFEQREPLRFI